MDSFPMPEIELLGQGKPMLETFSGVPKALASSKETCKQR